jgi:hypothetical protein
VNALSGDTYVFAEIDGKYSVFTLKELYELHKQGCKIKVPTLLNERGDKGWVEVEDVVSFKKQPLKRITLAISRVFVEVFQNTIIPAYSNHLFLGKEEQINPKLKRVNELKNIQDPRYNNTLLLATYIPLFLPEGNNEEWEVGFALGFYLSEGNLKYRKRKNTQRSLAKLNGFARKKGMTLEEYLEYMTDIEQVQLSVGLSDFERGYIQILQKHFKFRKPYKQKHANAYQLCSTDLSFFHLIKDYTEGNDSHTKRLKNEAFNQSMKFLEGIFDGFTRGDGHYNKNSDWIQVEITTNYLLYYDLIFIARVLGYDIHVNNGRFRKSPLSNNYYYNLRLSVSKRWHRHVALGLVREHIKKIENVGEKEAFNIVVKPLYPENDKRAKFNHLFFTAFGILVSDAVKTFDQSVLSFSLPVPVSE